MVNANLIKGGVIVVVLLAALAAFDAFGNYAYSQATGAAVTYDGGGGVGTSLSVDLSNYPLLFTKNEPYVNRSTNITSYNKKNGKIIVRIILIKMILILLVLIFLLVCFLWDTINKFLYSFSHLFFKFFIVVILCK